MTNSQKRETGGPGGARDRRCAVVAAGIEPGRLVEALRRVPQTRVGDICIFPANGRGEAEADYLILAANDSSRFLGLEDQVERWSGRRRSEEHTSDLQSLMRISNAVFCLKKKIEAN